MLFKILSIQEKWTWYLVRETCRSLAHACDPSTLGGRGRQVSMSSRPAWNQEQQGYTKERKKKKNMQKYRGKNTLGLLTQIKCSICSYQFNI